MSNFFRRVIQAIGDFIWDARNGRFTRRDGTPVDALAILGERQADFAKYMDSIARALAQTGMVDAWRDAMAFELRRSIIESYVLGRGGWSQITSADRAMMRQLVESEMTYLRQFSLDIAGQNLTEGQIRARMELYNSHLNRNYAAGQRSAYSELGYNQERRVLGASEHCPDCEAMAFQGWQELGTFPLPGEGSVCKANCQCTMEFREFFKSSWR
jgi:hypothetical protein